MSPQGKVKYEVVQLDGKTYRWDGRNWLDASYMKPPVALLARLNREIEGRLAQQDEGVSNLQTLMQRAKQARDAQQFERAEKLACRVLDEEPGHAGALAILASALRARHAPERALEATASYRHLDYLPLICSRAAAMCDLGMWSEAKREIARALAQGPDSVAFGIVNRIKAQRPELYE